MKLAARIGLWVSYSASALAIAPHNANASSHFETGTIEPVEASTHLDFKIVVPRVVYLGRRPREPVKNASDPAGTDDWNGEDSEPAFIASSNSGTIALARSLAPDTLEFDITAEWSRAKAIANRAYVVATP